MPLTHVRSRTGVFNPGYLSKQGWPVLVYLRRGCRIGEWEIAPGESREEVAARMEEHYESDSTPDDFRP